ASNGGDGCVGPPIQNVWATCESPMKCILRFIAFAALSSTLGCSKLPTRVVEFRGPANVVYTLETWEDNGGALSSDYSRVSAGLVGGDRKDRQLVMDGGYLE